MYSEQLESLIQSIIADGVITDKERAVLHKRAEAEGIDADEIDVYTEGLLVQSNKGSIKRMPRRYDKNLLMLETTSYVKYYKLILLTLFLQLYLSDRILHKKYMLILIIDIF